MSLMVQVSLSSCSSSGALFSLLLSCRWKMIVHERVSFQDLCHETLDSWHWFQSGDSMLVLVPCVSFLSKRRPWDNEIQKDRNVSRNYSKLFQIYIEMSHNVSKSFWILLSPFESKQVEHTCLACTCHPWFYRGRTYLSDAALTSLNLAVQSHSISLNMYCINRSCLVSYVGVLEVPFSQASCTRYLRRGGVLATSSGVAGGDLGRQICKVSVLKTSLLILGYNT